MCYLENDLVGKKVESYLENDLVGKKVETKYSFSFLNVNILWSL